MRKIAAFLCVAAPSLLAICHSFGLSDAAEVGKKTANASAKGNGENFAEEEKYAALIVDLGNEEFAVRDRAFRKLSKTPSALPILRRFLKDSDLERRTRIEVLIKDLSQWQFKVLLRETAGQKDGVPLDLMVDIVTKWKDQMDTEDWRVFFDAIAAVQAKLLKTSASKPARLPDPTEDFINYQVSSAEFLRRGIPGAGGRLKIVGEKTAANDWVSHCAVIVKKTIEFKDFSSGLYLANGNISSQSCGPAFVFCGGDVTCDGIFHSVVIARGRVKAAKIEDCIILDSSAGASRQYLFSAKMLGLSLSQSGKAVRVGAVADGSSAARSGFQSGDIVILADYHGNDLAGHEEIIRRSLANQTELVFRVERKGITHSRVLSVFDN